MIVAVLVDPMYPSARRAAAYVEKLAGKHPDAIVATAGAGLAPYEMQRAALRAGLRVASFQDKPFDPAVAGPRRPEREDEEPRPARLTHYWILLHELRPDVPEDIDRLWRYEPRQVGIAVGQRQATEVSLEKAIEVSEHRVVFSTSAAWPHVAVEDAQVIGA